MRTASRLTHAGGIVYRIEGRGPEILLVTARRRPGEWVFPKGHIDPGEAPAAAAAREVEEESGVSATVLVPVEDLRIHVAGVDQVIRYYLMRAVHAGPPREGRQARWATPDEAEGMLSFPEARESLRKAMTAMRTFGVA